MLVSMRVKLISFRYLLQFLLIQNNLLDSLSIRMKKKMVCVVSSCIISQKVFL